MSDEITNKNTDEQDETSIDNLAFDESKGSNKHLKNKKRMKRRWRYGLIGIGIVLAVVIYYIIAAIVTNPFGRFTNVEAPYKARFKDNRIVVDDQSSELRVCKNALCQGSGFVKSGLYMINSRYISSPRSDSKTVEGIAQDIHELRFDPKNPYIISGDHFTPFYNRSLGIFYYPTLDASIKTSENDWRNRELSYLQTLGFALSFYDKADELSTTIVPMGKTKFAPINVYSYPSDTMYSHLYAMAVLSGTEKAYAPIESTAVYDLQTQASSKELFKKYRPSLERHLKEYRSKVYDTKTGMIRSDIHLSGTKDITRRQNAFYDNVVYWRTMQLADKLGLIKLDDKFLHDYKQRILKQFWLADKGYFLEDQSKESIQNKFYSSDWLIALSTGFLDPADENEQQYYIRAIDYIQKNGIAEPFGLKYQNDRRGNRQFAPLRIFGTSSYGGDSIWSFWGLEYMKALLALYEKTGNQAYLTEADRNIAAYKQRMVTYGGFPELYDTQGKLYETAVYRSVRQTGWVIGFEQVLTARKLVK